MLKKIASLKKAGAISAFLLIVSLVLFLHFSNPKEEEVVFDWNEYQKEFTQGEQLPVSTESKTSLVVDVKGAIRSPGVYELEGGARIVDAIEIAGGFREDADQLKLNLAQLLHDEMLIYVPIEGEEGITELISLGAGESDGKISINQATVTDLEQLPGIGPAKAAAIITYRDEHGPFKGVEDLLQVSGIGPKSIEKLQEHLIFR
ncbi:helix-hairpin-helix domain-containing protein [Halalkalibacter alkaliphilus]|uniref:Helix-hairpin-helix domain-containing protein n=1 Tax=Halalkalibacter alkaliphilus TaxID=2917993 RepID=A0A9X2CNP2_9BACI|nr:helix-hairpin-helix domain-containing protein [Halalkalibacter alkaliphilus]MCL7746878.1 helix-hairpin-helix domain-containing protein [Halalkalibacter alkaliphilus]